MIRQIAIESVQPGMFILDVKSQEETKAGTRAGCSGLATPEMIRTLATRGCTSVYIDISRSESSVFTNGMTAADNLGHPDSSRMKERASAPLERRCSFQEELPRAIKAYTEGVKYTHMVMTAMQTEGRLEYGQGKNIVAGVLDSIEHNWDALVSLARLRATDGYLYRHCLSVCILVVFWARYSGKSREEALNAGLAALYHDIGKALVPKNILRSPRELSPEEYTFMREHSRLGYERLRRTKDFDKAMLAGVLLHHERNDGSGYPEGLEGEEIPELARMIGLCDIYDALTSRRPYKTAIFPHKALGVIYTMKDKELRNEDVSDFIRMLGIYPVGSVVELENGCLGVTTGYRFEEPAKPVITLLRAPDGSELRPVDCDLAKGECPLIVRCLPKEAVGIQLEKILGIPAF